MAQSHQLQGPRDLAQEAIRQGLPALTSLVPCHLSCVPSHIWPVPQLAKHPVCHSPINPAPLASKVPDSFSPKAAVHAALPRCSFQSRLTPPSSEAWPGRHTASSGHT